MPVCSLSGRPQAAGNLYAGRDPPTNDEGVDSASVLCHRRHRHFYPQHTAPCRSRIQAPTSWARHAIPLLDSDGSLLSHGAPLAIQGSGSSDVRRREADPRVQSSSVIEN